MEAIQKQYFELLSAQQFREEDLDPALLERHIAALSSSALLAGSAVSIFDLHRCEHAYESDFHRALFSDPQGAYTGVQIHPDDLVQVAKNGVAGMRHVFLRRNPNADVRHFKLIREYRALVHGAYKRVTEEFQIPAAALQGHLAADRHPHGRFLLAARRLFRPRGDPHAARAGGAATHRTGPPEQGDRRGAAHQRPYGQHPPAADPRETRRRQLARSGQVRVDPRDSGRLTAWTPDRLDAWTPGRLTAWTPDCRSDY